jgi:hypothetical protein|eukprot:COSAG06_NODE_7926_length_2332_cov_1.993283_3_plen_390_part_00
MQTSVPGLANYQTYQVSLILATQAENVHRIFGDELVPLEFPPAYQVATPFGADFGGVNPVFFESVPMSQCDSWLTVGITTGTVGSLLVGGLHFDAWNEQNGLRNERHAREGYIFWRLEMQATGAVTTRPNGQRAVVIAQLTLPIPHRGESARCFFSAKGRSTLGSSDVMLDWREECIEVFVGGNQNGYGSHALCAIDCGSHGSCSGGRCVCESGAYTGDQCQNYDTCYGIDCGRHGTCSGGTCTCESGAYTGDRCQNYDACYGIDCGSHGSCSRGRCVCESGAYTGDRCQNYNACYDISCGRHGSCSGGTCVCESGAYSGDRCQNYDNCFGIDCGAHGTCSDGSCVCENDGAVYTGERCDTCVWEGDGQGACYGKGLRPYLPMSTNLFV